MNMSAAEEITRLKALLRDRDDEIARIKSSLNLMGPECGVSIFKCHVKFIQIIPIVLFFYFLKMHFLNLRPNIFCSN